MHDEMVDFPKFGHICICWSKHITTCKDQMNASMDTYDRA